MAATTSVSPLLTLPLELRIMVYEHLLESEDGTEQVLYDDRCGIFKAPHYHSAIIHSNRQIYNEAVSVLYDQFVFSIELMKPVIQQWTGDYYADCRPGPRPLLRDVTAPLEDQGLISPDCLRRVGDIQIVTSADAVWGKSQTGYYFSHIGELVLEILRILADGQEEVSGVKKKRLSFEFLPRFREGRLFGQQESELRQDEMWLSKSVIEEKRKIVAAVQAVEKYREVEVIEFY